MADTDDTSDFHGDSLGRAFFIVTQPNGSSRLGMPGRNLTQSLREWYAANPGARIQVLRSWADSAGCQHLEDGEVLLREAAMLEDDAVAEPSATKAAPCPFCHNEDLAVDTYSVQPDNYHSGYVRCDNCDAEGPRPGYWLPNKKEAHQEAILAWNRYTQIVPAGPVVLDEPNEEMLAAGAEALVLAGGPDVPKDQLAAIYKAMQKVIREAQEE